MARIVVFGATGYTGRLTAQALVARGEQPVLAARSPGRLEALARELGGLDTAVADVARPESVRALVQRGDVLIATVGPFIRYGRPAVEAAVAAGAHYIDSTGEPPFIREVFERYGEGAARSGSALLTAMGYDFVPGNLAGALALEQAGPAAVRVDTGYYYVGGGENGMSGGTRASLAGVLLEPAFAWRDGRIVTERSARRVRTFEIEGRERPAVSVGGSDHFGLPAIAPGLREVNAYLGWFGPMSRAMQVSSAMGAAVAAVPGTRALARRLTGRFVKGSTGGPSAEERAKVRSHIAAIAYDTSGRALAEVHVAGVDGYTYTGAMLAWSAARAAAGDLQAAGALGPVQAFGLRALEAGSAEAGISPATAQQPAATAVG